MLFRFHVFLVSLSFKNKKGRLNDTVNLVGSLLLLRTYLQILGTAFVAFQIDLSYNDVLTCNPRTSGWYDTTFCMTGMNFAFW